MQKGKSSWQGYLKMNDLIEESQPIAIDYEVWSNWVDSLDENMCDPYPIVFTQHITAREYAYCLMESAICSSQHLGVACRVKTYG